MATANPPKPPTTKIPIPPLPDLIPDDDDFEDDEDGEDEVDAAQLVDDEDDDNTEELDQFDEDYTDEGQDEADDDDRDQSKKNEQKQKEEDQEQEEPGKKREEDPTKEANEDPRANKPEGEGAGPKGEGAGPEGAAGKGAGGAGGAGEGAASAAGEGAAAAGEGIAAAGEGAAAAGAAAAETAAAATAATEGAAVATATAPEWVPIVLIVLLVVVVIIVIFALGRVVWRRFGHSGDMAGSRASTAADVTDSHLREQIAELAAAAGDGKLRQVITKEKLADIFVKLNQAATASANQPARDLLVEHISAAKSAAGVILEDTSNTSGDFDRQLKQFQYHMNAIAAVLMGIGGNTPSTLVTRANDAFSGSWVWTGNGEDANALLRDGSNTVAATGATRGCDPTGFIKYVLRNPSITPTDNITPNAVDLPTVFAPALTPVDLSGGFKTDYLKDGDIVLTKHTTTGEAAKTGYGAFIYLGDTTKQLAYCGPNGLAKLPSTSLTESTRTVTALLRLRAAPL